MSERIHFEIFVRRAPGGAWILDGAMPSRSAAIEAANLLMAEKRAVAVRVSKETFHAQTGEFDSVVIHTVGAADKTATARVKVTPQALCVTPQDLYTVHARERIGRLLEEWLERERATPFELLHRPDLIEKLEASKAEMRQALNKLAIPEAHARNTSVAEMTKVFGELVERAMDRVQSDGRKGVFPKINPKTFAQVADRLAGSADRGYLIGGGIAAAVGKCSSWSDKVECLLDLADAAPATGPGRGAALHTLMQPLAEILGGRSGIEEVLGSTEDLGMRLAATTRLAAHKIVERLVKLEPSVAKVMPELSPLAARLAVWLSSDILQDVRAALGRRVLRELMGPRRLKPGDAAAEIDVLRALGMSLTAAAGKLLPHEDVQAAFTSRSKTLVASDFVEAYLAQSMSPFQEFESLIWLAENVVGAANKREASGWLRSVVESLRFERDILDEGENPGAALLKLAKLQRGVGGCGLSPEDAAPLQAKLGAYGGLVEAGAKVVAGVATANAPVVHRLLLLLKLAVGETAPLGPAADKAKMEALRLAKAAETRTALATASAEHMESVRNLITRVARAA